MEEKEQLEIRCDELETIYETTRHDLDVTREALARYHESQQESTRTGTIFNYLYIWSYFYYISFNTYLHTCQFSIKAWTKTSTTVNSLSLERSKQIYFGIFQPFYFSGIEHEESLLHESAMRESSLNTLNVNMEVELKQAKAEVHRLRTEKQSLEQEYNDLNKTKDVTTVEVRLRF